MSHWGKELNMEREDQTSQQAQNKPTDSASETGEAVASEFDHLEADEQELEGLEAALGGINQLTELGNRATQLGLIVGHGYHGGQYEILRKGEVMTLEPQAAVTFLQNLMTQASSPEQTQSPAPDSTQGAEG